MLAAQVYERRYSMDGETNGGQEATQGAQDASQQQGQEQQETQQQGQSQVGGETPAYEKQIAERDEKIASLEAQVAEAAKNAETAEQLRGEIAELKVQGDSDRIDFKLQLAGARNVKAARALLGDYDGADGADGFSPTATITITDKSGTTTANVSRGPRETRATTARMRPSQGRARLSIPLPTRRR